MLKTLANCRPTEFLAQTVKIKNSVAKWLTETDIVNIRRRMPNLEIIPEGATEDEKAGISKRNDDMQRKQLMSNLNEMFNAVFEEHPQETLEVLALCCFVEPYDIDNHEMSEYFKALSELISNESVLSFFTSLLKLAKMSI